MHKLSLVLVLTVLSNLIVGSSESLLDIVQGQEDSQISVKTDKESYDFDYPNTPIVIISGYVSKDILREGEHVVIQVLNPMGARYRVDFVNVTASDGSFEYHMPIGGPIADISGDYKVLVTYRGNYQSETTFRYDTQSGAVDYFCMMRVCTYEITISNITHVIKYRMTGTINNVTAAIESKSLVLEVETGKESGILRIALPRELINAEDNQGNDERFVILVDGEAQYYDDKPKGFTSYNSMLDITENPEKYRVLELPFAGEMKQVEIVGTWVAPDFSSSLFAIIVIISIASAVVWSRLGTGKSLS